MKKAFILKSIVMIMLFVGIASNGEAGDYGTGSVQITVYENDVVVLFPIIRFLTPDANRLIATTPLGPRVYSNLQRGRWYEFEVELNHEKITKDFIMPLSGGLSFQVKFYTR